MWLHKIPGKANAWSWSHVLSVIINNWGQWKELIMRDDSLMQTETEFSGSHRILWCLLGFGHIADSLIGWDGPGLGGPDQHRYPIQICWVRHATHTLETPPPVWIIRMCVCVCVCVRVCLCVWVCYLLVRLTLVAVWPGGRWHIWLCSHVQGCTPTLPPLKLF